MKRAYSNWRWHLDEVFVKLNGKMQYLWRAVDHEEEVLESFVTKHRDRMAALNFLRNTMKRHGRPHLFVTDKLRSYGAALKSSEMSTSKKPTAGKTIDPRSHTSHFNAERHLYSRSNFKPNRAAALAEWRGLCAA